MCKKKTIPKKDTLIRKCNRCQNDFEVRKGYAHYCSNVCRNRRTLDATSLKKRADKLRKPVKYTCQNPECGILFIDKPSAKRKYCSPSCASKVRTNNPDFKRLARERAIKQGFGGNRCRGHHGWYTSPTAGRVYLESSYEFKVAESLDSYGVKWIRPSKKDAFHYQLPDETRVRRYEADFYLPDYDVYLDPKNEYRIIKDKRKIRLVRQTYKIRLLVLTEIELDWPTIFTRYLDKERHCNEGLFGMVVKKRVNNV